MRGLAWQSALFYISSLVIGDVSMGVFLNPMFNFVNDSLPALT